MKFKILNIEEKDNQLRITVKSKYGEEVLRCRSDLKPIHIESGKPQWMHWVKERLETKYGEVEKKAPESDEFKQFINADFDTKKIEDHSKKTLSKLAMITKKLSDENKKFQEKTLELEQKTEEVRKLDQQILQKNKLVCKLAGRLEKP